MFNLQNAEQRVLKINKEMGKTMRRRSAGVSINVHIRLLHSRHYGGSVYILYETWLELSMFFVEHVNSYLLDN